MSLSTAKVVPPNRNNKQHDVNHHDNNHNIHNTHIIHKHKPPPKKPPVGRKTLSDDVAITPSPDVSPTVAPVWWTALTMRSSIDGGPPLPITMTLSDPQVVVDELLHLSAEATSSSKILTHAPSDEVPPISAVVAAAPTDPPLGLTRPVVLPEGPGQPEPTK